MKLHYKGHAIHRVVPGFLVQGGDITGDPEGRSGHSIYGPRYPDEGCKVKHTGIGQLLMANMGFADNNGSQFAVAMSHVAEFEKHYMLFGRVVEGLDVLRVCELEGDGDGYTSKPVRLHRLLVECLSIVNSINHLCFR